MKHILLLLLVISMSCGIAWAQPTYTTTVTTYETEATPVYVSMVRFGIKGGMNISHISGDDALASSDAIFGVHIGGMMQYPLMPSLIFQPEFIYTQKGHSYKYDVSNVLHEHVVSLDYLELPLLMKYNIPVGIVKIQPFAGAAVSYMIRASDKQTVTDNNVTTITTHNIKDDVNHFAAGLVFGAEVVIVENFVAGGRYVLGLTDVYDNGSDTQNGVFMLNVGYLFY